MRKRITERGEGKFGCILWLAVLGLAVLISMKLIPVKIASAELYDFMDDQARASGVNTTAETVKKNILARAEQLHLPLDKDHVTVERVGDNLRMTAEYTVPVDILGFTYNWHFRHELDRPIFVV
jgi:hypothetical protein